MTRKDQREQERRKLSEELAGLVDVAMQGWPGWEGPWEVQRVDLATGEVLDARRCNRTAKLPMAFAHLWSAAVVTPATCGKWGTDVVPCDVKASDGLATLVGKV